MRAVRLISYPGPADVAVASPQNIRPEPGPEKIRRLSRGDGRAAVSDPSQFCCIGSIPDDACGAAQQPRCGADKNSGWNAQQVSFKNGRNERKMIASSSGREGLIARPDPSSKPAGTVNCGMMRRRQCRCGASNPSFAAVSIT